ncbi:HicB family protein [Pseudodesulfovibrio sp. F-1]|uniref:HicB family protein n=1 Tax=Pseudodesulfovibrio alkaliphilus TaxID=2661613 RepID=A0A7K1KLM1_9BACT|nr:type II toxin-antitoxin system HicB family antitoxin [Pseudodesulfovibrio alkaliphilus]MUM76974.1 HicB family protein [Pseudodesulfovibrio alkaliphilus]
MQYVALLEQEKRGYSVTFPDFPECTTFGADMDEAIDQAHEALALYVEYFLEQGGALPEPMTKKVVLALPGAEGKRAININVLAEGGDFVELEVGMHVHLLGRLERYCRDHGISPADFLAVAARHALRADILND